MRNYFLKFLSILIVLATIYLLYIEGLAISKYIEKSDSEDIPKIKSVEDEVSGDIIQDEVSGESSGEIVEEEFQSYTSLPPYSYSIKTSDGSDFKSDIYLGTSTDYSNKFPRNNYFSRQ